MEVKIKIDGMSCQHCIMAVKKELNKIEIEKSEVEIGSAKINFDESKVKADEIYQAIEKAGYRVINN